MTIRTGARARVIATSSVDLAERAASGMFQEELLGILGSVTLHLPPLRQRMSDVPLLVAHVLKGHARDGEGASTQITREALSELMARDFPGNVSELEQVVEQAAVRSTTGEITALELGSRRTDSDATVYTGGTLREGVERAEKQVLLRALDQHHWRRSETAAHLGVTRATLYNKMRKYGILREQAG